MCSLTSSNRIRSQREKELDQREGDQIRERETRSEAARLGSRDLGRAASGGLGRVTWGLRDPGRQARTA